MARVKGMMEPQAVIVRKRNVLSTAIADDLVILNEATESFIGLDTIGRRIWDLLETPVRVDDLCDRLANDYAGDRTSIDRDVRAFLVELKAEGLIELLALAGGETLPPGG